jgi:hypothetical protein
MDLISKMAHVAVAFTKDVLLLINLMLVLSNQAHVISKVRRHSCPVIPEEGRYPAYTQQQHWPEI